MRPRLDLDQQEQRASSSSLSSHVSPCVMRVLVCSSFFPGGIIYPPGLCHKKKKYPPPPFPSLPRGVHSHLNQRSPFPGATSAMDLILMFVSLGYRSSPLRLNAPSRQRGRHKNYNQANRPARNNSEENARWKHHASNIIEVPALVETLPAHKRLSCLILLFDGK